MRTLLYIHSPTKVREQNFINSFFIEVCCLTLLILNDIQWVQIVRVQFKDPEKLFLNEIIPKVASLGTTTNMTNLVIFLDVISVHFGYSEQERG